MVLKLQGTKLPQVGAFILGNGIALWGLSSLSPQHLTKNSNLPEKIPGMRRHLGWTTFITESENTTSPRTPIIKSRDQAWESNYGPKENHSEKEPLGDHGVHMPDRSWCPLITSIGLFIFVLGLLFRESN